MSGIVSLMLNFMSESPKSAGPALALPHAYKEAKGSLNTSETDVGPVTAAAVSHSEKPTTADHESAAALHIVNGGIKGWLHVFAAFLMFISAW